MTVQRHIEEDKTYVLYKPGEPTREKEFKLKDLKARGLSLYYGEELGGESTYFLANMDLEAGDVVESGSISYRVERVIEKLPRKSKVIATITDDGLIRMYLKLYDLETGEYKEYEIYEIYADELLERICERLRLGEIRDHKRSVDIWLHMEKGDCIGIGLEVPNTIPKYKRVIRAARKLLKELPAGEFRLRLCDIENYRAMLRVPTLEVLEPSRAKEVESLFGMLARPEVRAFFLSP